MFDIIGRLRCPVCSKIVRPSDKVFLDIINTIIHQRCYHQNLSRKFLPSKDKGTFQHMLLKYPFLLDDHDNESV